ncbi:MAG: IS481 family transposase, partial [Propionibacteriales bacterium]|nr:IS481 family transposase [Propionibacteriales bacterium]
RYDRIDKTGRITLRRAGKLHHLHIAAAHKGTRVLAIADDTTVTTIALDTGEILATHTINPDRNYWPNTQKAPGRWPGTLQH